LDKYATKKDFNFILRHNAQNYGLTFCLVKVMMLEKKWIRPIHIKMDHH